MGNSDSDLASNRSAVDAGEIRGSAETGESEKTLGYLPAFDAPRDSAAASIRGTGSSPPTQVQVGSSARHGGKKPCQRLTSNPGPPICGRLKPPQNRTRAAGRRYPAPVAQFGRTTLVSLEAGLSARTQATLPPAHQTVPPGAIVEAATAPTVPDRGPKRASNFDSAARQGPGNPEQLPAQLRPTSRVLVME